MQSTLTFCLACPAPAKYDDENFKLLLFAVASYEARPKRTDHKQHPLPLPVFAGFVENVVQKVLGKPAAVGVAPAAPAAAWGHL